MSYNNQNSKQDKPIPSVEYTLKNIGWNIKVIAECLTKLVERQEGKQSLDSRHDNSEMPF